MPPVIADANARAYAHLPGLHLMVAVRSSATAEDLPGLSFAGQSETYVHIHGLPAVQGAVPSYRASLRTARAMGYPRPGIDHRALAVGVVVLSEVSGALFMADTTTGERVNWLSTPASEWERSWWAAT